MTRDTEAIAWHWLLALPRVPVPDGVSGYQAREIWERQIKITMYPGILYNGKSEPMVKVTILLPGLKRRVTGTGNSLYSACDRAQSDAWREGIKLPFLVVFKNPNDPAP